MGGLIQNNENSFDFRNLADAAHPTAVPTCKGQCLVQDCSDLARVDGSGVCAGGQNCCGPQITYAPTNTPKIIQPTATPTIYVYCYNSGCCITPPGQTNVICVHYQNGGPVPSDSYQSGGCYSDNGDCSVGTCHPYECTEGGACAPGKVLATDNCGGVDCVKPGFCGGSTGGGLTGTPVPCNCNCATSICADQTCTGTCGQTCQGIVRCVAPIVPPVIIDNTNNIAVAAVGGQNQICEAAFGGFRRAKFIVSLTDTSGGGAVNLVELSLSNGGIGTTLIYSGAFGQSGSAVNYYAVGTTAVNGNTLTVNFPIEFSINYPTGTYSLMVYGQGGSADTGWVDANRSLRVWNCQVAVSGLMYDSSDQATGAVCSTGAGFTTLAGAEMNFKSVGMTGVSNATGASVLATGGNTYSGIGATWGQQYVIAPNSDLSGSNVITRWLGSAGTYCGIQNTIDAGLVNPYQNNPILEVDFSAIRSQDPWFQVGGGGIFSRTQIANMVPITCTGGCTPAMTIGLATATNGLVAAPQVTNSSGCSLSGQCSYGSPNNWSYTGNVIGDSYNYNYFYNNYFAKTGLGYTFPGNATMTQIVANAGGTGMVLVNGNVNIDVNNAIASGKFLMVVAAGTINIGSSVTQTEGILTADQGIAALGTSDTQLKINGIVYSPQIIRLGRGYATQSLNNTNPATTVNYRPDLVFNLPASLSKVLTSWSQGK
jgi:hypothetical protein